MHALTGQKQQQAIRSQDVLQQQLHRSDALNANGQSNFPRQHMHGLQPIDGAGQLALYPFGYVVTVWPVVSVNFRLMSV